MNDNLEVKHYKRGRHLINKLINNFPDGIYSKELEKAFVEKELKRHINFRIASFDYFNFAFLVSVTLLGLNKEAIERTEKHNEYNYLIDYEPGNLNVTKVGEYFNSENNKKKVKQISDISTDLLSKGYSNKITRQFDDKRNYESMYDDWLAVESVNSLPNYHYDYLYNVRNALMHSEYSFETIFDSLLIASVCNSDYTNFSAKIYIPKYLYFIKHFFSNDAFYGIVDKLYLFGLDENIDINNEDELREFLTNQVDIAEFNYQNNKLPRKRFESILMNNPQYPTKKLIEKYKIETSEIKLTSEQIEQIMMNLKSYYGDDLYKLKDKDLLSRIIVSTLKYQLDPKSVLSSWIMHYYDIFTNLSKFKMGNDDFVSGFAMMPSLLLIKSYNVLYRLQNKELANYDLEYDLMEDVSFDCEINYYNDFVSKQVSNGTYIDDIDSRKRYFTNVFRNSLAHGNIDVFFKEKDGKIEQYLKLEDKYKTRVRTVSVSLNNLNKYLNSECFDSKRLTYQIANARTI